MFLLVGAVLVVLWLAGFLVFHIAGGLIHLLLVVAMVSIVWNFVAGRKAL